MKRVCQTIAMVMVFFVGVQEVLAQGLRMIADVNPASTTNTLVASSRTVFNNRIFFTGNNGSIPTLYAMDGSGAVNILPQIKTNRLHNTGSLLIFWGDDGSTGMEPWRSDGTVNGSYLLKNINKTPVKPTTASLSYLEGGIVTIGSTTFFGCIESIVQKPSGLIVNTGLYKTDGTPSGTLEIRDDLDVQKLIELNGSLIVDGVDPSTYGRELWISDGTTTVPIGTLSPGAAVWEDDYPYEQWYTRHVYVRHEPVATAGCTFFNTRSLDQGNELWCTNGTALRQITGLTNGAFSTYPVQMTPLNGVLYFVGLDEDHGSELWSFPLTDPMNSGAATLVQDLYPGAGRSEPCWLTAYAGDLYFSAYTEATGRELFRYNGTTIQLVADIAPGSASSNPKFAPTDKLVYPEMWDDSPDRFSFIELNGKLYFAANNGINGNELWSYDAATNTAVMVWDVNAGIENSDPKFMVALGSKLYFEAYTPVYGRAWYEYDPGGSPVNQPPVAVASATPLSGTAPLTVSFDGSSSYDPDGSLSGYAWDFGDGSSSSNLMSPNHTYSTAGTYTALLTVTDNSSATATDSKLITVNAPPAGYVHVEDQTLTRVTLAGNKIACKDVVLIEDDAGLPVSGAIVSASYSGPTSGSVSGTTGANGEATLQTSTIRKPSGFWTFTVTDVQATGLIYELTLNVVTTITEGTPKGNAPSTAVCVLEQNHPNPFHTSTTITFDVPEEQHVLLCVTDMLGREVARLVDGPMRPGMATVLFDAARLPAGIYICQLNALNSTQILSMLVLK